jgi:hypothetical protein
MICELRSSRRANSAFPRLSFVTCGLFVDTLHSVVHRVVVEKTSPLQHFGYIFLVYAGVKLLQIDETYLLDRYNLDRIRTGAACSRRYPSVKSRNLKKESSLERGTIRLAAGYSPLPYLVYEMRKLRAAGMQNMNRSRTQINQGALCGTGSVVGTIANCTASHIWKSRPWRIPHCWGKGSCQSC